MGIERDDLGDRGGSDSFNYPSAIAIGGHNRGNAETGLGDWRAALTDYQKASEIPLILPLHRLIKP